MSDSIKSKVYVLYTGGTIGMVLSDPNNTASPLKPASKEELIAAVPGLGKQTRDKGIEWVIEGLFDDKGKEVPPLDSSDVNSLHWSYMAAAIERAYNKYDGFVVLHGTDTMAYTASALSFLLANLAKPVVVTGSQLPISSARTDAIQNFVNSLLIAGYKATGLPLVPEVSVCFRDSLLRGNRTRKVSTSSMEGFASPNYPRLGTIGEHIKINEDVIRAPADNGEAPFFAHKDLETDVMDITLFPGLKSTQLEALLDLPNLRGIVLRTFGSGNAPSYPDLLDVIAKAVKGEGKLGKVILNVTQCNEGMVEMGAYEASSGLLERGVISGLDMTPEAALTKMMLILKVEQGDEVHTQLQINQRGEQSESLLDIRYRPAGKQSDPVDVVRESARPPGDFRRESLKRAVLRVAEIGFADTSDGEDIELRVFINLPNAGESTPSDDPHCAFVFRQSYQGSLSMRLLRDVTSVVKQVAENGRAINVTLVPSGGKKIWCKGLCLALFTRS